MMQQLEISFDSLKVKGCYYNTTSLKGTELVTEKENAVCQEERIYQLFRIFKIGAPSEMLMEYNKRYPEIPITSLRRGMTNLKKEGKIYRSDEMKIGPYGKPEHYYKII